MSKQDFVAFYFSDRLPQIYKKATEIYIEKPSLSYRRGPFLFSKPSRQVLSYLGSRLSWVDRFRFFFTPKSQKPGLLFIRSCNGVVVLDFFANTAVKFCKPSESEPHFIENEKAAFEALPQNSLAVLKSGEVEGFSYVVSDLIVPDRWLSFKVWKKALRKLGPILFQYYQYHGVKKLGAQDYCQKLKSNFLDLLSQKDFLFLKELKEIFDFLDQLKAFDFPGNELFLLRAHGDFVPNNILSFRDKKIIFDWANGGWRSLYYDLFIQDFYFLDSKVWTNFSKIQSFEGSFFSWEDQYSKFVEKMTNRSHSVGEVKAYLLLAIAEVSLNNFSRYQFNEIERENGQDMMNHILSLLKVIVGR